MIRIGVAVVLAGLIAGQVASRVLAQTTPPPPPPLVTTYWSSFKRLAPVEYVWVGPRYTVADCLSDASAITGAASGVGSTAWGYIPVSICYPVTSATTWP